jgi:hypothetical protein
MVENLGVEPTVQETPKPAYKTVSIAVFALLGGESPPPLRQPDENSSEINKPLKEIGFFPPDWCARVVHMA